MKETIQKTYCDILSEHNGLRVEGAHTYKDLSVMMLDALGANTYHVEKITMDLCPACYAKYTMNLFADYDYKNRPTYSFREIPLTEASGTEH